MSQPNTERDDYGELYGEIIAGKSEILLVKGADPLFLRHPSYIDQTNLRAAYFKGIKEAESAGIPNEEQMVERAVDNGWWSASKEEDIRQKKLFISRMRDTVQKVFLPSQKEQILKSIQDEEKALYEIIVERNALIQYTAETYAAKKLDEYYLLHLLYKDAELTTHYCDKVELDDLDESETEPIASMASITMVKFKGEKIKKLAATSFFQGLMRICQDDCAHEFYGKAVCTLSTYQCDLFTFGNYFKKMIKNSSERIPDGVFDSPESLIEWCEIGQSSQSVKRDWDSDPNAGKGGERSGRMSSLVGAKPSDYEKLGLKSGNQKTTEKSLLQMAKEAGGSISIYDVVKKTE